MVKRKEISTNEEREVRSVKPIEKKLKVRVGIKNCIKSNSQSNLRRSKNDSTPLELPLVKSQLSTDLVNSFNNENTLPAQCKFNNKSTLLDKLKRNNKTTVEVVKTKRNLLDECNVNNDDNRLQDKHVLGNINSKALITKKVPLKKKSAVAKADIKTKHISPPKNQNQLGSLYPSTIRRCDVRLRRISATKKTDVLEKPSISSTIKGCVFEMQSTQIKEQAKQAPTSAIIKKCVVKLRKIPKSNKNTGDYEMNESGSSSFTYSVPVIDSNVRHNFRKLSLSKTLEKRPDKNEIENVSKLNLINNCDRGAQESIKNDIKEASKIIAAKSEVNQCNTQEIITKLNDLRSIKHLPKLSLRKKTVVTNKNITNLELTQPKLQQNSSICFEPVRNSTLLELRFTKDKRQEVPKEETGKILLLKNKSSSQNLANKSEEIENLLNSLDREEEVSLSSVETKNKNDCMFVGNNQDKNFPSFNNTTKQIFHYKKNTARNILEDSSVQNSKNLKTQKVKKKGCSCSPRSSVLHDDIYEFLSQSQTSDSDIAKRVDPTADIIQKLIKQGKVRLATAYKGKGKTKFKNVKSSKKKIKIAKPNADTISKPFYPKRKKVAFTEENQDYAYEDHYENDHVNTHLVSGIDKQERDIASIDFRNPSSTNHINDQEGMDSNLARSVLMNQVRRSDSQRKDSVQRVKKFVSTPKNNKLFSPKTTLDKDLSPISMAPPRLATVASPWRINEDAHLPKTFNFSTSSANLPSFSCDFIPSTPRKVKEKICLNESPIKSKQHLVSSTPAIPSHIDAEITQQQTLNLNNPSVLFSFSSNDSNAENIPPPTHTSEKPNENDSILNSKTRRAFNNRSSLKPINILEVLRLPPYVHPKKTINQNEVVEGRTDMLNFENNLGNFSFQWDKNEPISAIQQSNTSGKTESGPKEDLFGFEEFLSQTEYSSQENCETINNDTGITHIQNQSLHDKLQNIRKLKPREEELQKRLLKENSENCTRTIPLFDDKAVKRQRGINEMLCSTMLNARPSTSKDPLRMLNDTNIKDPIRSNFHKDLEFSTLFIDAEPETTFNENDAHRTYTRPHKRKRRLRENNYVVFLDSDESEDDSPRKQKNYQQSREVEHNTRKKRIPKECKESQELINFVEEFKKTCQEVDCYELIVEKSTH